MLELVKAHQMPRNAQKSQNRGSRSGAPHYHPRDRKLAKCGVCVDLVQHESLGKSGFVEQLSSAANERMDHRYQLQERGYSFEMLVVKVSQWLKVEPE